MAITLDTIAAGMQPPQPYIKTGIANSVAGALRGYTHWYVAGNPGASVANAAGINGQAVTMELGASVGGRIRRTNPPGGTNAYLARLSMTPNVAGSLWLIDRVWQNSGLVVTSTTAQAITPAALPARCGDGTANGANIMAMVEWSATGGAGAPTVTLTYTDQDGNAGNSAALTGIASPPVGTCEIFTLAAGDTGIRAPTSFIQSATRTSGTMHLVLFRILATVETPALTGSAIDAITGGRPRIYDDSTLQIIWIPSATTASTLLGSYVETHVIP